MVFDDIIIGSGISALGVALALAEQNRSVLCMTGAGANCFTYYPAARVPSSYDGGGGLGSFWHGVIPTAASTGFDNLDPQVFRKLFERFYPGALGNRFGSNWLFVPFRPIRPYAQIKQLSVRCNNLVLYEGKAERIVERVGKVVVQTQGQDFTGARVIVAAGALATPGLLAQSSLVDPQERAVSDHIIGYAGRAERSTLSHALSRPVPRNRHGMFLPCDYSESREALYMLRPARFDMARLDSGMEKRAVFGLPTARILAGLSGRLSPGLIAEAIFNRFGIGRLARWQSVNFLSEAPGFYTLRSDGSLVRAQNNGVTELVSKAVRDCPFAGLEETQAPKLFIPGIHLHGSLTKRERDDFSPAANGRVQVADASAIQSIGSEHHSFKLLCASYQAYSA